MNLLTATHRRFAIREIYALALAILDEIVVHQRTAHDRHDDEEG